MYALFIECMTARDAAVSDEHDDTDDDDDIRGQRRERRRTVRTTISQSQTEKRMTINSISLYICVCVGVR